MTFPLRGIRSDRLRELARDAIGQGFRIALNGSGHPVLVSPSGERVWFSSSTSSRDWHGLANARAALMRAGYVPPERRGRSKPVVLVAAPRSIVVELEPREVPMIQAAEHPKRAERGGYSFAPKGKSIAAEDVIVGGQPFRIRTNADGSLNATTLRRQPQRSFQSKLGDRDRLVATLAAFARDVDPWEDPMPDTAYQNGHAAAADPAVLAIVEDPLPLPDPEPEPEPEPKPSSLPDESEWPGLDEHVDRVPQPVVVSAFVDLADYPIARALDELDRAVAPAVAALEAAGKVEAADLIRGELAKTPAEAELLALFREVQMRPRLEPGDRSDVRRGRG